MIGMQGFDKVRGEVILYKFNNDMERVIDYLCENFEFNAQENDWNVEYQNAKNQPKPKQDCAADFNQSNGSTFDLYC